MLFEIDDWVRYAQKQRRFTRNNSFFNDPQVTHRVSKSFKGRHRQDRLHTICESPEHCAHLNFPGSFDCNSLESGKCDSEFSRKHLNGKMSAGYEATFGHDEVADKKDLHEDRGYFFGGITLEQPKIGKILSGAMDGNFNIGLIRDPLEKPFEDCHHIGRWYGRIHAGVRLPDGEKAFLTANIALDIRYEDNPSWLGTDFVGTLEGMLIRECKKAKR